MPGKERGAVTLAEMTCDGVCKFSAALWSNLRF